MLNIDIALFAHNEAERIGITLTDLAQQTIFADKTYCAKLLVLCNGCKDATSSVARAHRKLFPAPDSVEVLDLGEGGKSRTWNTFVHRLSRPNADVLVFMDADIRFPQKDAIGKLVGFLQRRPDIEASSSMPIKDISYYPMKSGVLEKVIAAGAGTTGHNLRTAICGQLYVMRSAAARAIALPIGLPVEDGFVRHAIITSLFSADENEALIDQPRDVIHVYPSERTIPALLKHQIRIVIGSAINAALFAHFAELRAGGAREQIAAELAKASRSADWLPELLQKQLPNPRFGWVPWPWLYMRTYAFMRKGPYTPRRTFVAVLGLVMDVVVYLAAQLKMSKGVGAGHW